MNISYNAYTSSALNCTWIVNLTNTAINLHNAQYNVLNESAIFNHYLNYLNLVMVMQSIETMIERKASILNNWYTE